MIQKRLRNILSSGESYGLSISEGRNIVLTNYISIICLVACIVLLLGRLFYADPDYWGTIRVVGATLIFVAPILMNRWGWIVASRIILCWLPSAFVLLTAILSLSSGAAVLETSGYVGLRLFLISFFCFPFLVFSATDIRFLMLGLLGPLIAIFFYDPILTFFGVGYWQKGLHESTYYFNTVRTIVASLVIGSSSFFLKRVIEKSDSMNEKLIGELAEKNILIQHQAADVVAQSEKKYRSLFEQASDAICITDVKGNLRDVNSTFCAMFRYAREELVKMNIGDLIDAEQLHDSPILFDLLRDGQHIFSERVMFTKTGERMYVEANVKKFGDSGVMAIVRDVTDRRRIERQIKNSEANLNSVINNTNILIWSIDRDFNLIAFNKAFFDYIKKHYGVEIEVGKRVLADAEGTESTRLTNLWNDIYTKVMAGDYISHDETRYGIDFHYSLSPIVDASGYISGVNIFANDVTAEKRRAAELSQANKKIGELKLMALRSVMNPHFVFNVLNSIQYFIAGNDRLNAINYLSTFSKLIRSILNHSVDNLVKISDEIDMLRNYVQLEMIRFENKFDFILDVDPNLEIEEIEIPSLLVQPYVENAILHGLNNKKEHGTLTIRIIANGESVLFEIEDDGIGREAAVKLRDQNFPKHKSMGLKVTEERLRLINEHHNVSLEIIDLRNENGPCGTRVRIGVKG